MKILIVTQYFYPETFKSNDMAFEMQKRGHDVTVLTGIPNYPEGKFFEGYGFFKNRTQTINNVKIHRAILCPRGNSSGVRLFINYFSWAVKAITMLRNKYDAIIVHEPSPPTQFFPALLFAKWNRTKVYFWVLDLWPESLQIAGGINNRFVLNFFRRMVQYFYANSFKILISSRGFAKSILEKGDFKNKLIYFPNWGEDSISSGGTDYPIPRLPEGFKVMFAGNIGESQDMESIVRAANLLKNEKNIHFIFVGDGRKITFLKEFIRENELEETVHCAGRHPIEAMSTFFSEADVMLVSLKDDSIFNLTVPAKIQAYMSAGKPIIAMLNGEGANEIVNAQCGVAIPAGNHIELAKRIFEFSRLPPSQLTAMADNSRRYYVENFTLTKCIDNLEQIVKGQLH